MDVGDGVTGQVWLLNNSPGVLASMFSELSPCLSVSRSDFRNDEVIGWSSSPQSGTLVLGPAYLKTHGHTSHSIDDTRLAEESLTRNFRSG